jgi:hypothetical protein
MLGGEDIDFVLEQFKSEVSRSTLNRNRLKIYIFKEGDTDDGSVIYGAVNVNSFLTIELQFSLSIKKLIKSCGINSKGLMKEMIDVLSVSDDKGSPVTDNDILVFVATRFMKYIIATIQQFETKKNKLEADFNEEKRKLEADFEKQKRNFNKNERNYDEVNARAMRLERELEDLNSGTLQSQLREVTDRLNSVESTTKSLKESVKLKDEEITSKDVAIAKLKKDQTAKETEIAKLKAQLSSQSSSGTPSSGGKRSMTPSSSGDGKRKKSEK